MRVRPAGAADLAAIVEMSVKVQAALEATGSLQRFGPLEMGVVRRRVRDGAAYVLETADGLGIVGSAFADPVTAETFPPLAAWGVEGDSAEVWYVSKVMIEPACQGNAFGQRLMQGVKDAASRHASPVRLVLDCWAGNEKLRMFYTRAGFALQGVFREESYEIAVFTWRER
jgi:GNAT superfamily N-acetyltransferase